MPSKGGYSRLLLLKTMCPNLGGFDEEFYGRSYVLLFLQEKDQKYIFAAVVSIQPCDEYFNYFNPTSSWKMPEMHSEINKIIDKIMPVVYSHYQ